MKPEIILMGLCFTGLIASTSDRRNVGKLSKVSISAFLLLATAFTFVAVPAHAVSSYTVSVGYADDLRPTPFFPNPWCGGANVALFASDGDQCGGNQPAWDSGAVMITNTGAVSITISSLTVTTPNEAAGLCDSGCSIWGGSLPFTLAPGMHAIFAQTVSYNFDTSDNGLSGIGPSLTNNCNAGAEQGSATCLAGMPSVSVDVDGTTSTYNDVGFVINTAGYDVVYSSPCPNPADTTGACNESLQWRDISSTCGVTCPGGNGVPEFGLSALAVAAFGLAAVFLVRRKVMPRTVAPVRVYRQPT